MAPRALLFIGLASSVAPCSAAMRRRDQSLLQVTAWVPAATKATSGTPGPDVVARGFLGQGIDLIETDPQTFESLFSTEVYDPYLMEYHACKPPNFKWSMEEHTCKCDLECKSGGVLDLEECVCQRPSCHYHDWTGSDCSGPENVYATEVNDPDLMEYHACKPPNFKWSMEEHACKCDLECKNGGVLDVEDCVCQCPSGHYHDWTGSDCSSPENVNATEVYDPDLMEYHTCKPPNFKWSMEEHTCKCDLECKNGGVLDMDSCECVAPAQIAENLATFFGGPEATSKIETRF